MLIETVDNRIARAHNRLKLARTAGDDERVALYELQLDKLLDLRLHMTREAAHA